MLQRFDCIRIDWLQVSSSLLSNKSRGLTTEWSTLVLSSVSFDRTIWAFQKLRIFNLQERNLMIAGMRSFYKLKFLHAISLWMPPAAVIAAKELEPIPANVEQEVEVGHGRAAKTRTDSRPCHTHGRAVEDFVSFGGPQGKNTTQGLCTVWKCCATPAPPGCDYWD